MHLSVARILTCYVRFGLCFKISLDLHMSTLFVQIGKVSMLIQYGFIQFKHIFYFFELYNTKCVNIMTTIMVKTWSNGVQHVSDYII